MVFALVQLLPWTILTALVFRSYIHDPVVEKRHLLWATSGIMMGFFMSFIGSFLAERLNLSHILILKFFDICHLFGLYAVYLVLTDFEQSKRRLVRLMSLLFVAAATLILFDPTSRVVEGGVLTAAYGRGVFSSGVMLTAMVMWGYAGLIFHRFSLRESRPHLKRSTRYFSLACLFAVLSYASAVILYVILNIKIGMILARTLPILAGFWLYLGARTPNLLSSLHQVAQQRQQLGEERERLRGLSAGTALLKEIADPAALLASVLDNAKVHTGADVVALTRWHRDIRRAETSHLSFDENKFPVTLIKELSDALNDFVPKKRLAHLYKKMILQRRPLEMRSLREVFNHQIPGQKIDRFQQAFAFEAIVHYPLYAQRRYQGTLTFAFSNDNYDRNLVEIYAHECEQIIYLTDLLERTRQHSRDLELTNALMQSVHQAKLQKSYDLNDLLKEVCNNLRKRLNGDFCGIWQFRSGQCSLLACATSGDGFPADAVYPTDGAFPKKRFLRDFKYKRALEHPLHDSLGQLFGYVVVARKNVLDFSRREMEIFKFYAGWISVEIERERQAQKLQASEEKYRGLVENALEGIFQISPEGRFLTANPALVAMLGYESKRELFEVDIKNQLFAGLDDYDSLMRDLSAHGKVTGKGLRLRHKDGGTRYVLASARQITDDRGNVLYYEGVFQDITQRKLLERQLLRAQKMESIGTLASGVAHDFNNSLSAILPMAELIRLKAQKPEVVEKCINVIIDAAKHSTKLAGQLLALSRDRQLAKKTVDVNEIVSSVARLMQKTLPSDIALNFRPANRILSVSAEVTQIEQMLINLVINARDALCDSRESGAPKEISVVTAPANPPSELLLANRRPATETDKWLRISVTDNGLGMDQQTLDHIFEPFYTTKEVGAGTGLGLAMVYAVVQNHDGLIDVKSKPGHGTTFEIYLPVADARADTATEVAPGVKKGRGRLLVVDDQKEVRESLGQILHALGYETTNVESGDRALQLYDPKLHDAVILDVSMPGLSGVQTFKRLQERYRDVRVLLISGFAKGNSVESALNGGAYGFIRKPFDLSQISSAVYRLINHDHETRV